MQHHSRPSGLTRGFVVVAILMLAYALAFLDRTVLSLVVDPLRLDQGLSESQIGLLTGFGFITVYALVGIPLGRLADSGNRRNLILACVLIWSLSTAAFGLAQGFVALAVTRILVGVGEAGLSPAAYSLIAAHFPRKRLGLAIGIYTAGVSVGSGLALVFGGIVVERSTAMAITLPFWGQVGGWRLTFLLVAALGVPVAVLIATIREPVRLLPGTTLPPSMRDVAALVWRDRRAFTSVLVACPLAAITNLGQLAWAPTYFMRVHGFSPREFGVAFGIVLAIGGFITMIAAGLLTDALARRGHRDAPMRLNIVALAIQGPFAIAAFLARDAQTALYLFMVAMLALTFQGTLQTTMVQILAPAAMRGRVAALYLVMFNLVASGIGPLIVALVTEHVFGSPLAVGKSLALVTAVVVSPAALLLWWTLPGIRAVVARREAEEAALV